MPQGAGYGSKEKKTGSSDPRGGQRSDGSYGGGKAPGKAGNATVADHMVATGEVSTPSIGKGGVQAVKGQTQDDAYNDYSQAVGDFETRSFMERVADVFGGPFYDVNEPDSTNPNTFHGGTFHSSTNPLGVAGMLAGAALAPGWGGTVGAQLGSWLGGKLGVPDVYHHPAQDMDGSAPAAGPASGTHGILNGGGKTTRDGGRQTPVQTKTTGILNAPKSPAAPPVVTPTTPPPSPATNPQYPSPDQVFGQSGIGNGYVYDPATGRMIPRPQAAA